MKQVSARRKDGGGMSLFSMPGQHEGSVTVCATISVNRLAPHSTLLGPLQHSRLSGNLIPTIAKAETMGIQAICDALDECPIPVFRTAVGLF